MELKKIGHAIFSPLVAILPNIGLVIVGVAALMSLPIFLPGIFPSAALLWTVLVLKSRPISPSGTAWLGFLWPGTTIILIGLLLVNVWSMTNRGPIAIYALILVLGALIVGQVRWSWLLVLPLVAIGSSSMAEWGCSDLGSCSAWMFAFVPAAILLGVRALLTARPMGRSRLLAQIAFLSIGIGFIRNLNWPLSAWLIALAAVGFLAAIVSERQQSLQNLLFVLAAASLAAGTYPHLLLNSFSVGGGPLGPREETLLPSGLAMLGAMVGWSVLRWVPLERLTHRQGRP